LVVGTKLGTVPAPRQRASSGAASFRPGPPPSPRRPLDSTVIAKLSPAFLLPRIRFRHGTARRTAIPTRLPGAAPGFPSRAQRAARRGARGRPAKGYPDVRGHGRVKTSPRCARLRELSGMHARGGCGTLQGQVARCRIAGSLSLRQWRGAMGTPTRWLRRLAMPHEGCLIASWIAVTTGAGYHARCRLFSLLLLLSLGRAGYVTDSPPSTGVKF